jgi:hypothetical protein
MVLPPIKRAGNNYHRHADDETNPTCQIAPHNTIFTTSPRPGTQRHADSCLAGTAGNIAASR